MKPYINSKYDVNRVWQDKEEVDWEPSELDMVMIEEDISLDASYE